VLAANKNGSLKEIFGVGTAALVVPVKELTYKDETILVETPKASSIGSILKKEIEDLRAGTVADKLGWLVPVVGIDVV
jgi:branched-chain amino acid aminotransferase